MGQRGYRAERPRSYHTIEKIAQGLRSVIGLSPTDPLPGVALFERLDEFRVKHNGRTIPLNYGVKALPHGVEAQAAYNRAEDRIDIILTPETYQDLENGGYRARFSLPHELGHVYLHTPELLRLSHSPHADAALKRGVKFDYPVYEDTEWQADVFAASMLMPGKALDALQHQRGPLSERAIQSVFGVSHRSAEIRLRVFEERGSQIIV
jgi:IrrE N-terminal-like domain